MAAWINDTGTSTSTTGSYYLITGNTDTGTTTSSTVYSGSYPETKIIRSFEIPKELNINKPVKLKMADGSVIDVDDQLNFKVIDKNAKVTYKGTRNRAFNKYINASDLLEQFISDMGKLGAVQSNILNVPIETFINWLIFKAAEQDGEEPDKKFLPKPQHRCKWCGKFMLTQLAKEGFNFCNPKHSEKYFLKLGV